MIIYIAGPYSSHDPIANVQRTIKYAETLRRLNHIPIIPHLSMLWHMMSYHDYEYWLGLDIDMINKLNIDEVHRLTGASPGADREVVAAMERGIPVKIIGL